MRSRTLHSVCEALEVRRVLSPLPYPSGAGDLNARLVGAADFNADGAPDLLWQDHASGEVYVELQVAPGNFDKRLIGSVADGERWHLVGIADVDGDSSTPDLVWFDNLHRTVAYWQVQGLQATAFRPVISEPIAPGWRFEATGNFDGDHDDADFLWRNYNNGRLCVWSMSLGAAFGGFYIFDGPKDLNWAIEYADDFTGDGVPDLVWRNYSNGKNCVWEMAWQSNTATPRSVTMLPALNSQPQAWDIEAIGEFSNDNLDDIVWRNYTTGEVMIWMMNDTIRLGESILFTRAE